ncbi:centriolin-like [Symsagittifera roscoffensis]|uniref:centriolin-like n=1 Tax=Symsagittifera roscoffensis TaxID=84072 RepID=UPI00307B2ED0
MSRIPVMSPEFSQGGHTPRSHRSRLTNSSVSPVTDRSSSHASPPSQKLVMPGARTRITRSEDPKSDTAMLTVPRSRKDNSVSPGASRTRIAKPVPSSSKSQVASTSKSPARSESSPRGKTKEVVGGSNPGVLYITEKLLFKITQVEYLHRVTELNLSIKSPKKIKFIEKLDALYNLKKLNLSNNIIEKIAGLEKLKKLEQLDLSNNLISLVGETLENLGLLHELNLRGNKITTLPKQFGKGLVSLRSLDISANQIANLKSVASLENLPNLAALGLNENPFCSTDEFWEILITYRIPTLANLDGRVVTSEDHRKAHERFGRMESDKLNEQLRKTSDELINEKALESQLRAQNQKLIAENKKLLDVKSDSKKRLTQLERDTENNNQLLARKAKEVNKLVDKNYELEQELAFFKIDKKFGNAGSFSDLTAPDNSDLSEDMPYIGRATAMTPQKRPKKLNLQENGMRSRSNELVELNNHNADDDTSAASIPEIITPRTPTVRFQEIKEQMKQSETQLNSAQKNLTQAENDGNQSPYFRNRELPPYADKLSPNYLPGPKTGYRGFVENKGELPWRVEKPTENEKRGTSSRDNSQNTNGVKQNSESDSISAGVKKDDRDVNKKSKPNDKNADKTDSSMTSELSINPKPILDDAIVKYRSLQQELDQMLKMVRNETATVMGLERQLNIAPPPDLVHCDGNFPQTIDIQGKFPVPLLPNGARNDFIGPNITYMNPSPTSGWENYGFDQEGSGFIHPQTRSPNIPKPKNPALIQNDELKVELSTMAESVCEYMTNLRKEIARLHNVNNCLENNLEVSVTREKANDSKIVRIQDLFIRLEHFLTSLKVLFEDMKQLELKNRDLKVILDNYPDQETLSSWKENSDQLPMAKQVAKKMQGEIIRLQHEANKQSQIDQKLRHEMKLQNERASKSDDENQKLRVELDEMVAKHRTSADELTIVQKNFSEYIENSIKPEDLQRHVQVLAKGTSNFSQMESIQMIHQNDISGRILKDYQLVLNSKIHEMQTKINAAENREQEVNKKLIAETQENEELKKSVGQTRKEYSERRETDRKEIEFKIKQWKKEIKSLTDNLQKEKSNSQNQLEKFEITRGKLKEKIDILERELLIYDSEISQTHDTQRKEKSRFDRAVESFQQNEKNSKDQVENLQKEIKKLQKLDSQQKEDSIAEKQEMEQEISNLKAEVSKLNKKLSSNENEWKTNKESNSVLKKSLTKLQIENQELEHDYTEMTQENESLKFQNKITAENSEKFYETEIQKLGQIISALELKIWSLTKEKEALNSQLLEKRHLIQNQQLQSQTAEERIRKEFSIEIENLEEKLDEKDQLLHNSVNFAEKLENLENVTKEKETKLQNLEEKLAKTEQKFRNIDQNWSELKKVALQQNGVGEIVSFLEGRTSNFVLTENMRKNLVEINERRAESEQLSRNISEKKLEYEYIKRKTEELYTEISRAEGKKAKTEDQLEIMKQLLAASQWQVKEYSQMANNLYR